MARTPSTMLALGTLLPRFSLPDTTGKIVSEKDFSGRPLLVAFICNHCPFVIHIRSQFAALTKKYQEMGIAIVAINANDVATHPDDSPEKMKAEKQKVGYAFPYLFDETQAVAHAFQAACTPDFFLFNKNHKLFYRGQFDASRPGNDVAVTGKDLEVAMIAVLSGEPAPAEQRPSLGCNIKWKPGNEPKL